MPEVVIVEAGRSAVGRRNGTLAGTHPADILGPVINGVLDRAGVASSDVEQVVGGCVDQVGAQAMNITRTAWLSHGGDIDTACTTVDAQCGSSQQGVNMASSLVAAGVVDVAMGVGVENMSMVPIASNARAGAKAGLGKPVSRTYFEQHEFTSQFEGAERIATKYGITRADTDALALASQQRGAAAIEAGLFESQIVPVQAVELDGEGERTGASIDFSVDQCTRETTLEGLAGLAPVAREDGIHTAGSSSQIADGAGAVLVMNEGAAHRLGATARARIADTCLVGCDPVLMLEGPIVATERLLERNGLSIGDIDVFEVNEAFASVVLAWSRATGADLDKVNPNGGAIALGHPLGGTGSILVTKALNELERVDGEWALVSMCCGGGLGTGTLIQRR